MVAPYSFIYSGVTLECELPVVIQESKKLPVSTINFMPSQGIKRGKKEGIRHPSDHGIKPTGLDGAAVLEKPLPAVDAAPRVANYVTVLKAELWQQELVQLQAGSPP